MERFEKLENAMFRLMARAEIWAHARIRHSSFHKKTCAGALVVTFVFQAVYSLVITGTTSFEEAEEVCDRRQRNPAAWSRRDKINGLGKDLYPINYFSTVQMFATTLCVLLWLFFSPHNKPEGATLDKSLGSIFIVQFLASACVNLSSPGYMCMVHGTAADFLQLANVLCLFGGSIIITNILAHRYLMERARVMNEISAHRHGEGFFSIDSLKTTVKWEARAFLFTIIATVLYLVKGQETNSMIVAIISMAPAAIMDLVFTTIIIVIFLVPVFDVLKMAKGKVKNHGTRKLERTKWRSIIGVSLVVISSTLLYIDLIYFLAAGAVENYHATNIWWLNAWALPSNLDVVLNEIGILIICGLGIRGKKIHKWVGKYFPAYTAGQTANAPGPSSAVFNFKAGENKVVPDLSAGIDSHAYDDGSEGGKGTE